MFCKRCGLGSLNDNLPQFISIGRREYWNRRDGQYLGPAHDAVPLRIDPDNPLDFSRPERPLSAQEQAVGKMLVDRIASGLQEFSIDAGVGLTNPPNPNAVEGFDVAESIARNMVGQIDPNETLVATRDIMTDFRNGDSKILHALISRAVPVVGNRAGITVPAARYRNQTVADREGVSTVQV